MENGIVLFCRRYRGSFQWSPCLRHFVYERSWWSQCLALDFHTRGKFNPSRTSPVPCPNPEQGIVTVLVAISAFFLVHDFPETATFLTEEERAFVVWRLKYQSQPKQGEMGAEVAQNDEFSWKAIGDAFKDWQCWLGIGNRLLFLGTPCSVF
jgi:hypothetical protein